MLSDTAQTYPHCPFIIRTVQVGGLTKTELIHALQRNAIALNAAGETLFASDQFTTAVTRSAVTTVELTVGQLGFPQGATSAEIYARAGTLGLALCPLELGPYLRLQYRDQPEGYWGQPVVRHQAPPGSITIASAPLTDDDDVPKGFYLRRIEGVLWLRGYRARPEHVWAAADHVVFVTHPGPASGAGPRHAGSVQLADRNQMGTHPCGSTWRAQRAHVSISEAESLTTPSVHTSRSDMRASTSPLPEYDHDKVDAAVLALLYLMLHQPGPYSAWPSFAWAALDRLHQRDMIDDPKHTNTSVALTDAGVADATAAFALVRRGCRCTIRIGNRVTRAPWWWMLRRLRRRSDHARLLPCS
jgi:hypothetical protein